MKHFPNTEKSKWMIGLLVPIVPMGIHTSTKKRLNNLAQPLLTVKLLNRSLISLSAVACM
jgi:hypothetical protein